MRETTWTLVQIDGACPLCGEQHKPARLITKPGPQGVPLTSWSNAGYWIALDGQGRVWFHGPWGMHRQRLPVGLLAQPHLRAQETMRTAKVSCPTMTPEVRTGMARPKELGPSTTMTTTAPTRTRFELLVNLPGVVSWTRPVGMKGGVRYPAKYLDGRDQWALAVRMAVYDQEVTSPTEGRFHVEIVVQGGGKRDIDRVANAVLDALQNGGVLKDDCLVDRLLVERVGLPPDGLASTAVIVRSV